MEPNGAMGAHDDHAVDDDGDQQIPGKVLEQKEDKEWQHTCQHQKADKGDPVLPAFKDIHAGERFRPKLLFRGDDKFVMLILPSIRWCIEKFVNK